MRLSGTDSLEYYRLCPILIRSMKLGVQLHPSVNAKKDHPSKNCLKPRNFSRCPLWSSKPTARCKPRFLQLKTLPQYVSHKALAQERSSTQSTIQRKKGGNSLIPSTI